MDVDVVMRYFVIHNFVCNGDSYTGTIVHNYYLHEKDGKLAMVPWDYNLAFGSFQSSEASSTVNADIDHPVSGSNSDRPMLNWIFLDGTYTEQYHALFQEFLDTWFSDGQLTVWIAETADMIRPYVVSDPTKFCTLEDFDAAVETITRFVALRAEAVQNQLHGETSAVETDGLDLRLMGGMSENNGGPGGMPGGDFPQMPGGSGIPAPNGDFSFPSFSKRKDGTMPEGQPGAETQKEKETGQQQTKQHQPRGNRNNSAGSFPPERPGESSGAAFRKNTQDHIVIAAVCAGMLLAGILFAMLYHRRSEK